jgi:hypothetical protein
MNFTIFIFMTALLDSLNPSTIITQLLLLIKTKSTKVSGSYIAATFVTYLSAGLLLYFGIANNVKKFFSGIKLTHSIWLVLIEVVLLIVCVVFLVRTLGKSKKAKSSKKISSKFTPKAVFVLGAGATLADIPTAIPYFAFIGKMETVEFNAAGAIILFFLYCSIYVLPLFLIHYWFIKNEPIVLLYVDKIGCLINKVSSIILTFFLLLAAVFLIVDIVRHFNGLETLLSF